ncbi:MAG TPA: hypothetical protein VF765_14315 [Polyangiaceae bacterium]
MGAWSVVGGLGASVAMAALITGCIIDSSQSGSGGGVYGGGSSSSGGTPSGSSSGGSLQPMLVDVDPNQTMNATPGEGVGVFVQYKTGGHWTVWWTCDTNKTNLPCSFDNTVTVSKGTVANVGSMTPGVAAMGVTPIGTGGLEAQTNTTTGVDGVTFDTPLTAGDVPVITVDAKVNGQENPTWLFFVQDSQINGGTHDTLTDPLMFEPSTP